MASHRRQCEPQEVAGLGPRPPRQAKPECEDRLLFASDYPHPDHKWPDTVEAMLAMPIPDAAKKKVLWDNPAAFYRVS